jgi:probable phosphoglycerate mutase
VSSNEVIARVLLIRHGQSLWNIEERWQGRADIELSELGIQQARAAADKLGSFEIIASSHLQRALHTATIISEIHGVGPVEVDERLQETHVGPWEGLTRQQIEQQWPGYIDTRRKPEGFEPDESIVDRLTDAIRDFGKRCAGGSALIISHSGVIRTLRHEMGASNPRLPNLGGSWFNVLGNDRVTPGDIVTLLDENSFTEAL